MLSLNSNADDILEGQKIFNKMFSSIKLNKKMLNKYKTGEKTLDNKSLKYEINIPKNFYTHTKNSDRIVILKPISNLSEEKPDEITIRKFISSEYSGFSEDMNEHFKIRADVFIKNLTKYAKNIKIEKYSTKIIDQTNAIVFKTIESNSINYVTTLNYYIFIIILGMLLNPLQLS